MPFPAKTFRFDPDAKCLTGGFYEALKRLPKARYRVEDVSGVHVRELVALEKDGVTYLVGPKTGTVFDAKTGLCLSGRARVLGPLQ